MQEMESMMDEMLEDPQMQQIFTDPVAFAKGVLNITPRWYQVELLRHKSKKKVARMGRRNGKCIYEESTVLTGNGPMKVKDLHNVTEKDKPSILTLNQEEMKLEKTKDYFVLDNGLKEVFKLRTNTGKVNYSTGNHPYLVKGEDGELSWIDVDNLKIGDKIATPSSYEDLITGKKLDSDKEAFQLAYSFVDKNEIPEKIMSSSSQDVINFLSICYKKKGDMKLTNNQGSEDEVCVSFCLGSDDSALKIQHLFLRIGIRSIIKKQNNIWFLIIKENSSLRKFLFNFKSKNFIKDYFFHSLIFNSNEIKTQEEDEEEVCWEKITSIEEIGQQQTYDMSVPNTNTFISDDIISHNTFTMVLHMLWYAFTHPESRQLVIGPMGIQVDTIFDELRKFIKKCPILEMSMTRSTQSPQRIEFGNGAIILGLSAGTTSGSGAKNMRGQGASWIYLDETDYLSEEDINSIMGMSLQDMDKVGIWCSSTPTGARKKFWEWCTGATTTYKVTNKDDFLKAQKEGRREDECLVKHSDNYNKDGKRGNGWVQFFYPSWTNPSWNDEMDTELKAMFSSQGYIHEVEGKFGDETIGVFNKEKIEQSLGDYTYKELKDKRDEVDTIRVLSADWDKYGAATQIVISELDPDTKRIRVAERVEIPSTEFTFDNAVNRIVKLVSEWKINRVYVDRGYGEYQVEMLKKRLGKGIVKGVAFQEKIEVIDPTDKTRDKKMAKHFMINQTSILLERDQILLSKHDEMIHKQMEAYRVIKRSKTGQPIYTSENEHALDAFMLTVLCFTVEYPEISKVLEKRRSAGIIGIVNKKLKGGEQKMFQHNFKDAYKNEDDQEHGEPDYVRHMMSIKKVNQKKEYSRNSWSPRGGRKSSGRKKF